MKPGMKIKVFPDTNKRDYMNLIRDAGFYCKSYRDYILVGERIKKEFDKNKLAKTLRVARRAKGITREQIAERIGVLPRTVLEWEIGRKAPQPYNLERYCAIAGIKEEEIEKCKQ